MKTPIKSVLRIVTTVYAIQALATASTYYVSTSGSDAAAGSESQPWRTIQKAADIMVAGDIAVVTPGEYPEKVQTRKNGTAAARITFRATSTNAHVRAFSVNNAYQVISGFTLTGIGQPTYGASVVVNANGSNATVTNNVFDSSPAGVYQLQINSASVANMVASGNSFLNGNNTAVTLLGTGHLVSHNFFTSPNGNDAIRLLSSNTTISDNEFRNWSLVNSTTNHPDLIQGFVYNDTDVVINNVIERNLFADCAVTQIGIIEDQAGLGNIGYWTWRNNIFVNVESIMSIWGHDIYFYNNLFYRSGRNSGHPLYFRESVGARIPFTTVGVSLTANTIATNQPVDFITGEAIIFYNTPPAPLVKRTVVYYAHIVNGSTFTVHTSAADATNNVNPIQFTNTGNDTLAMGVSKFGARGIGNNGKVFNNLFVECGSNSSSPTSGWYGRGTGISGFQADNNLVIGTGAGLSKTGFQTSSLELNGINGRDPSFLNSASYDFHLRDNSPCIGKGNAQASFGQDFYSTLRGTSWDLGPIEYAGAPINSRVSYTAAP